MTTALPKHRDNGNPIHGMTFKVKTPLEDGSTVNLFVTINQVNGELYEVFLNSNSSNRADHDIIARLLSQSLKAGVKVGELIENLWAVRGMTPLFGTGKRPITCTANAVAYCLEQAWNDIDKSGTSVNTVVYPENYELERAAESKVETADAQPYDGLPLTINKVVWDAGDMSVAAANRAASLELSKACEARLKAAVETLGKLREPKNKIETDVQPYSSTEVQTNNKVDEQKYSSADKQTNDSSVQGLLCPECSNPSLVKQEGCMMCPICGFSRCG